MVVIGFFMVVLHPFVNHTNEKINELKAEAESIRLKVNLTLICYIDSLHLGVFSALDLCLDSQY